MLYDTDLVIRPSLSTFRWEFGSLFEAVCVSPLAKHADLSEVLGSSLAFWFVLMHRTKDLHCNSTFSRSISVPQGEGISKSACTAE
jgi:hypothetical protein